MERLDLTPNHRAHRWLNLIIPGAGLIACGAVLSGLIVSLLFILTANFAIAATLIVPDDVPRLWTGLTIGVVGGTYIGAQFRLAQTLRERQRSDAIHQRREILSQVHERLLAGDADGAFEAIERLRPQSETDLLVAYRRAQVLTARGDGLAAQRAWQHLKLLDRHHIYRDQTARYLLADDRAGEQDAAPSEGL